MFFIENFSFGQPQYTGPIPKPTSGYGSDGLHTIGVKSFTNLNFLTKQINIYYPSDIATKVPTIFYSHAYGGNNPENIIGMLNFIAMKGYAIVFVPYQTTNVTDSERYVNLLNGFRLAARNYPSIIDTTKVGFLGHSFGGGASFANAYKCFTENNWGQNGRFIFALAQWYSLNITQAELQSFPANTKLLTEIFDDDVTNDHRMAIDIFNNINISPDEKDFVLLKSDTIAGYIYSAVHNMPNTDSAFNAFDYYAYYRLLDALCDYTFNGNPEGKSVALGNGSTAQISMPTGLKNLIETDYPTPAYSESKYEFPFNVSANLRAAYFDTSVSAMNNGPVCTGSTLNLTGAPGDMASYFWIGPDGFSSALQNPTISDSATTAMAGTYILTVTLSNEAKNIAITNVIVNNSSTAINNKTGIRILPGQLHLEQNYPNPFNPVTNISFNLPSKSFVTLKIFDVIGKEITTIISKQLSAGSYTFQWNGVNMSSGLYFYRLQTGNFSKTKKLLLLK